MKFTLRQLEVFLATASRENLSRAAESLAMSQSAASSALRELETGIHCVRSGGWAAGKAPPLAHKVTGRRVGILGLGRIGREIADRLAAFKCEIHYQSRSEKQTPGWTRHADAASLAGAVDDLFIAVVVLSVNLITDLAYGLVDPRIRYE